MPQVLGHEAENYMGKASEQAKQALAIFRDLRDAEGEESGTSALWDESEQIVLQQL